MACNKKDLTPDPRRHRDVRADRHRGDARVGVEAFAADADRALVATSEAAAGSVAPAALPALERDLPSADGDPRQLLVRRELEEVALDIAGMHAALDRLAAA